MRIAEHSPNAFGMGCISWTRRAQHEKRPVPRQSGGNRPWGMREKKTSLEGDLAVIHRRGGFGGRRGVAVHRGAPLPVGLSRNWTRPRDQQDQNRSLAVLAPLAGLQFARDVSSRASPASAWKVDAVPLGAVHLVARVFVEVAFVGRCAVERRRLLAGANPARQLSLQPVAIGAGDGGRRHGLKHSDVTRPPWAAQRPCLQRE